MNLSAQNLAKLRSLPQRATLHLSIYKPKTLFQARVTGSYSMGDTQISYYSVVTGSYFNTYPNMQVLVGSTQGGDERGRIRMRAATGTYSVFAENNIIWEQGDYLTFVDYVDIEAVFPRIIQDPNNDENVIFYKDTDIPYSNQNSIYGTFPNAGPHRAAFRETGTVSLYYTATGTYNVRGDSLTYSWAFEGGTPTGSTALTPGFVSYQTPGHYKTRLIVTSSSGAQDVAYRYVSIYDRPHAGIGVPILHWEISEFSGNRSEGGYTARVRVRYDLDDIHPNALVVIFADTWYGGEKINLGGNAQSASSIFFVGYILKDSIQFNYKDGYVDFEIGSVTEVMKRSEGFSVSCESKVTPTTWFELQDMTVPKAVYHYLRWHSTVLNTTDFQYTGDDRLVQYFDADRSSLYDAVNSFIQEGLIGEVVADRQGKIWAEITPIGLVNPISTIPNGFTIQKQDWIGEPSITRRRASETSFIELGGIVYNGAQINTFQALLTNAPSFTPLYHGNAEKPHQGLILLSQEQLNQLGGHYLAARNAKFEDVSMPLKGTYTNLDIAPQEKFYLLINPSDSPAEVSTIGYPFRLMSMNWQYNMNDQYLYPDVAFEQIATGTAGKTLIIPPEPPTDGYEYPNLNLPPLPDFNFGTPPVTEQVSTNVLMFDTNNGFIYTKNFDSSAPSWIIWNAGIDAGDKISTFREFFITPNGAVWVQIGKDVVYRAPYLGGIFRKVLTQTWLAEQYPNPQLNGARGIAAIGYRPDQPETVAFVAGGAEFGAFVAETNFWIFSNNTFTKGVRCDNVSFRTDPGSLAFDEVGKKWTLIAEQFGFGAGWDTLLWRFNETGTTLELQKNIPNGTATAVIQYQGRARDMSAMWFWNNFDNSIYLTTDNGENLTQIGDLKQGGGLRDSFAIDPTGQFLVGNWDVAQKGKSGDYGYTWSALATLPPGGNYVWAHAGGEGASSKWIAARGVVRWSPNNGNSWIQKEGDLYNSIAIPNINGIFAWVIRQT